MAIIKSQEGFAHPMAVVAVVGVVSIIGVTGMRIMHAQTPEKQVSNAEQKQVTEPALPATLEGIMPVAKLQELVKASDDSIISQLELKTQNGVTVYQVTLSSGKVLAFNAATGAKVTPSTKAAEAATDDEGRPESLPEKFTVTIAPEKARQVAKAKYPGSTITRIELGVHAGKAVFSVRFADKARVDVDANTGAVVRTKDPVAKAGHAATPTTPETPTTPATPAPPATPTPSPTTSTSSSNSGSSSSSGSTSNSRSGESMRVEGVLAGEGGVYSVTVNGTKYTLKTPQDISALVGKKVRAEGVLQSNNTIAIEKVEARD
ncbi:MAG TPA: PepSY domain-containing protein [Candidatus Saccharimonadales bacterium]|nr:PepSY domain-containing protein [Candidatus Saccharimonadales bacterium]